MFESMFGMFRVERISFRTERQWHHYWQCFKLCNFLSTDWPSVKMFTHANFFRKTCVTFSFTSYLIFFLREIFYGSYYDQRTLSFLVGYRIRAQLARGLFVCMCFCIRTEWFWRIIGWLDRFIVYGVSAHASNRRVEERYILRDHLLAYTRGFLVCTAAVFFVRCREKNSRRPCTEYDRIGVLFRSLRHTYTSRYLRFCASTKKTIPCTENSIQSRFLLCVI